MISLQYKNPLLPAYICQYIENNKKSNSTINMTGSFLHTSPFLLPESKFTILIATVQAFFQETHVLVVYSIHSVYT